MYPHSPEHEPTIWETQLRGQCMGYSLFHIKCVIYCLLAFIYFSTLCDLQSVSIPLFMYSLAGIALVPPPSSVWPWLVASRNSGPGNKFMPCTKLEVFVDKTVRGRPRTERGNKRGSDESAMFFTQSRFHYLAKNCRRGERKFSPCFTQT